VSIFKNGYYLSGNTANYNLLLVFFCSKLSVMQLDLGLNAPITISELTRRIKDALEGGFADVWVTGEITNLRIPSSGHVYFTLKDKDAQVKAVFFRSGSRFLRFRPEDGLEVIVRGRVSVYEPRGEYQIITEYMEPKGVGALQLAFLQLKDKLGREGLFEPERKRPLPAYPKRVGVVTSPTGAAIRDILKVLFVRAPGVQVLIAPASVQGDSAPSEIASAIYALNAVGGLDVMIVGRGGGSMEDLAAFNTEVVARAIHASNIPVISAVGHEVDFTVADFVADMRAPTPSAAAEMVSRGAAEATGAISSLTGRMAYAMSNTIRHARGRVEAGQRAMVDPRRAVHEQFLRLDDHTARLTLCGRRAVSGMADRARTLGRALMHLSPGRVIEVQAGTLSAHVQRLRQGMGYKMGERRQRLGQAMVRLDAAAPLAPLARGFAFAVRLPGMETITEASQMDVGDMLRLRLSKGELDCRVEAKRT